MNPLSAIRATADAIANAQVIHGGVKYFANQVKATPNPYKSDGEFTFYGPKVVKADPKGKESYVYYGSAPTGIVEIFSADELETSIPSYEGKYFANLFFSKPTAQGQYYDLYAVIHTPNGKMESDHISVTALKCPNCK